MSSHHFVKEGQEPALFIVEPLSLTLIEPLLEWAPLVLVSEGAIDEVLKWKIKIDVLITNDTGSLYDEKLSDQAPVKLLRYSSSESMLAAAFNYLAAQGTSGVNLVMNADDQDFDDVLQVHGNLSVGIITEHVKWSTVAAEFKKWLPEGATILIRAEHALLSYTGLISAHAPDGFKTERDGTISIKSEKPFWVGEPL